MKGTMKAVRQGIVDEAMKAVRQGIMNGAMEAVRQGIMVRAMQEALFEALFDVCYAPDRRMI